MQTNLFESFTKIVFESDCPNVSKIEFTKNFGSQNNCTYVQIMKINQLLLQL